MRTKIIPFRSKLEMVQDIGKIIFYLHKGEKKSIDPLLEDLKSRSLFFDEEIQQDTLLFAGEVSFQWAYDPWHLITPEIAKAANRLIDALGFCSNTTQPS